jgi:hypothetical protein
LLKVTYLCQENSMISQSIMRDYYPNLILAKFGLSEDHINNFILAIKLLNIQHADVVCHHFPYTFENKSFIWYFSLDIGSIINWEQFGYERTPTSLILKLSKMKMDYEERIKDFN